MEITPRPPGPVYILGSGFSRAVSDAMPVTHELGDAIAAEVGIDPRDFASAGGFEGYLSSLVTRMPFLPGHVNDARAARASQVLSAVATHLSQREAVAAISPAPLWLQQLVALWHAERATVITFNYDMLVERAVNDSPHLVEVDGDRLTVVNGSQVVRPAPRLDEASTMGSTVPAARDSMLLVKLHGSLNWFWRQGDPGSAVRAHLDVGFNTATDPLTRASVGSALLDRFLIPPVYSKDNYYASTLNEQLWRVAGQAVADATEMHILGYSLPPEDRIVGELLRQRRVTSTVTVVNREPGEPEDGSRPVGRLRQLGVECTSTWPGATSVADFTNDRIQRARSSSSLRDALVAAGGADVVLSMSRPTGQVESFCAWVANGRIQAEGFRVHEATRSSGPPRELVHRDVAVTGARLDDFLTAERLTAIVDAGTPPTIELQGETVAPVACDLGKLGAFNVVHLRCVPTS